MKVRKMSFNDRGGDTMMCQARTGLRRLFRRLAAEEHGNVSVEFVILFPVMMVVLGLILDVVMVYNGQSRVLGLIQDANRMRAIGELATDTATEQFISENLNGSDLEGLLVSSTVTKGVVSTSVQLPSDHLQMLGVFRSLAGDVTISVTAQQVVENWEV